MSRSKWQREREMYLEHCMAFGSGSIYLGINLTLV